MALRDRAQMRHASPGPTQSTSQKVCRIPITAPNMLFLPAPR